MPSLIKAYVFIDWHNAEANAREKFSERHERYFQNVIFNIQEEVARILKRRDSTVKYRTYLRVYHGWHSEDRPTADRQRFEKIIRNDSFGRTIGRVSFTPEIQFGNELACGSERNPLFDTSRAQGQKMVDTAIVCDLLYILRTQTADVGIIVSDDDDYLPAIFTAEAWGLESVMLRTVGHSIENVSRKPEAPLIRYWGQS
jgi:uncharacterized LabA/DUF88 family protein